MFHYHKHSTGHEPANPNVSTERHTGSNTHKKSSILNIRTTPLQCGMVQYENQNERQQQNKKKERKQ
jgi:hypothetical protein